MPRTKQRTPELRERLLVAATDLLADGGAAGLTTRSLAARAETSAPALYELFGDKAGVVRELYFEGFRQLGAELSALAEIGRPGGGPLEPGRRLPPVHPGQPGVGRGHVLPTLHGLLAGPEELAATSSVRILIVGRVRRCIDAGRLRGDETDVAHVLVALIQGMAFAEAAGRLGTSTESVERRWRLAHRRSAQWIRRSSAP